MLLLFRPRAACIAPGAFRRKLSRLARLRRMPTLISSKSVASGLVDELTAPVFACGARCKELGNGGDEARGGALRASAELSTALRFCQQGADGQGPVGPPPAPHCPHRHGRLQAALRAEGALGRCESRCSCSSLGPCAAARPPAAADRAPRSPLAPQVRALAITPEGAVLTGSRDKTIKLWSEGPDGAFTDTTTLVRGCCRPPPPPPPARPTPPAARAAASCCPGPSSNPASPAPSSRWATPTLCRRWPTYRRGCWRAAPPAAWSAARATRL